MLTPSKAIAMSLAIVMAWKEECKQMSKESKDIPYFKFPYPFNHINPKKQVQPNT